MSDGEGVVTAAAEGVVEAGGEGVVALEGLETVVPDRAGALFVVMRINATGEEAGTPGATTWLTTDPAPTPDPVVGALPEALPPEAVLPEEVPR